MARPVTPTAVKKRQGTDRPDRRKNEPKPVGSAVKPVWVKGPAAKNWQAISVWLEDAKLLTALDAVALGLLCDALGDYLEAGKQLGNKLTDETSNGNLIQHPLVGVKNKAWERVVKLLREFGMTPSARAGMAIANAKGDEVDPLLAMMEKRMGSRN